MIRGTVLIDRNCCKGCELCISACPQDCLGLSPHLNVLGYRFVQLTKETCTGCINCALVCPDSVFTVYRQPKSAIRKNPSQPDPV